MKSNFKNIAFLLLLGIFSGAGLAGCDSDGPMEDAGEELDEAAQDTKRAIDDATD
jgi:hypothetical protein